MLSLIIYIISLPFILLIKLYFWITIKTQSIYAITFFLLTEKGFLRSPGLFMKIPFIANNRIKIFYILLIPCIIKIFIIIKNLIFNTKVVIEAFRVNVKYNFYNFKNNFKNKFKGGE